MAQRSPLRWLAPLALVAFALALVIVVGGSGGDGGPTAGEKNTASPAATKEASSGGRRTSRARRSYVVKPGDTPSGIAEATGVPLDEIERLNPDLDPQALAPGDRIRLR